MNITAFLRLYLLYIVFNIGGWVYFGYMSYYTANLSTQTCYSYTKELTDAIKFMVGISMSITTLNIFIATGNILNRFQEITTDNLICILTISMLLLSIAGMNSLAIFSITSGMTDLHCSDDDVEFGIKIAVYGVIWIAFIEAFLIFLGIMNFMYSVILNAKLHKLCENCFDICKKYRERRIAVEPTIPKYNTDCVSIPICVFKEEKEKEPKMLCSVCYDSAITLLLEPCNHICICELCYNSLIEKKCPICKSEIFGKKKVFFVSPNL
jgi:hypothetical protein